MEREKDTAANIWLTIVPGPGIEDTQITTLYQGNINVPISLRNVIKKNYSRVRATSTV